MPTTPKLELKWTFKNDLSIFFFWNANCFLFLSSLLFIFLSSFYIMDYSKWISELLKKSTYQFTFYCIFVITILTRLEKTTNICIYINITKSIYLMHTNHHEIFLEQTSIIRNPISACRFLTTRTNIKRTTKLGCHIYETIHPKATPICNDIYFLKSSP